jgi:hypothetical protein
LKLPEIAVSVLEADPPIIPQGVLETLIVTIGLGAPVERRDTRTGEGNRVRLRASGGGKEIDPTTITENGLINEPYNERPAALPPVASGRKTSSLPSKSKALRHQKIRPQRSCSSAAAGWMTKNLLLIDQRGARTNSFDKVSAGGNHARIESQNLLPPERQRSSPAQAEVSACRRVNLESLV